MRKWGIVLAVLAPVTACGQPILGPEAPPAAPEPSTTRLMPECTIGRLIEDTSSFDPSSGYFMPADQSTAPEPSPPTGFDAYRVKLTDNMADPVSVAVISVVFYNQAGTEMGSDSQAATGILTSNQSLYWTRELPSNSSGASRCDVVGWNAP